MAYTREQKAAAVEEIKVHLEEATTIYITNYSGLTVQQVSDLRGRFRQAGVQYKVLKNTLLRRAMDELGGYEEIYDTLHGPTAVAFSEEPAAPARVMKDFLKAAKIEIPELKGAYVDGAVYGDGALDVLADLKSKDEILGDIIGLLLSPINNVVGALQGPGGTLAGAIQTLAEREEA